MYDIERLNTAFMKEIEDIDYEKIHKAMKSVDWFWWCDGRGFDIPTPQELKDELINELYPACIEHGENFGYDIIGGGGWEIEIKDNDWVIVRFNFIHHKYNE